MCDNQGSPNPDGAALTGHATVPCKPDSNSNIYASTDPNSPKYFGLGPGQAYEEMQFYPPGWVPWPAGIGCNGTQWCVAHEHRHVLGKRQHRSVQQHLLPEHGRAGAGELRIPHQERDMADSPANPHHPEHFTPNLAATTC